MNLMKKLQAQKIKSVGDIPSARFGHTLTMIGQGKAILFGGAISENGRFSITNDTFLYDIPLKRWKRVSNIKGEIPGERAAHAAAAISSTQLAVYGGAASGQQGLLKDDLFVLDLKNSSEPVWKLVQLANNQNTPGTRYGHVMVFCRPYLVVFGGNTGTKTQNDVWIINLSKTPTVWTSCTFENKPIPCPRVYHSAALCTQGRGAGMVVIYGGRKQTRGRQDGRDAALNDIWGLMRHSNGTWDWIQPPKTPNYTPIGRYQHLVVFMGTHMLLIGGRTNPPQQNTSIMQIYDMQQSVWSKLTLSSMFDPIKRHRHAGIVVQNTLIIHGGFGPQTNCQPSQSLLSFDLSNILLNRQQIENNNNVNNIIPQTPSRIMGISRQITQPLRQQDKNILSINSKIGSKIRQRDLTPTRMLTSARAIKLSNQVLVAKDDYNRMKIQKIPVNNLTQQGKRLTIQPQCMAQSNHQYQLIDEFLNVLLPSPGQSRINTNLFPFQRQKIVKLCKDTIKQLQLLPSNVVYLRSPIKIFGSIYGRYYQLLRLFQNFGMPDQHQMETYTYVFLGNYVDKGYNSLQTICLLMALKLKYPDHIVLLRGCHQDPNINKLYGFAQQCSVRVNENICQNNSIYNYMNKMFQLLPLAAVIQDKLICVHNSIGNNISLQDIQNIPRPLKISDNKNAITMLWSGYQNTYYNNIESINQNNLNNFLQNHNLATMIRSRQALMDGFIHQGNTISIFSVSNYGKLGNNSAILKITKNLTITNHVLQPIASLRGGWLNDQNLKTNILFTEDQIVLRKKMFSPPRKK